MHLTAAPPASTLDSIHYPSSDGLPMADNSRQLRWIFVLAGNLMALFRNQPNVLVGGNLLWYPLQGHPDLRVAPDVFVVFGRPKGDRDSYQQWNEDDVPMTVVFEILSPGNSGPEMADKQAFYDDHGVQEYYLYDPETNRLHVFLRKGTVLCRIRKLANFVSPRLGISFDLSEPELVVRLPDGQPFLTFEQIEAERQQAQHRAENAEQRADTERQRADTERQRADTERQRADTEKQRADTEKQRAENAEQRLTRLVELSQRLLWQQASPEEQAELQRLLQEPTPPS